MKLLIVDDAKTLALLVQMYLVGWALEFVTAADGEEGFKRAKELSPDLIISDVQMPKMDGFEVCTRLRQDTTLKSGILMLTDNRGEHTLIESLERGADEFMSKPFSPRELSVRVRLLGARLSLAQTG